MKRKVKLLAIGMWIAFAANAADATATKGLQTDPLKGEALFNTGLPERNVPACTSCHGTAGNSGAAINPKLAGQPAEYTVKQLINYKTRKERDHAVMSLYAQALSEQEMRDIAAYLEKQIIKPGTAKTKEALALGQKIYRAGLAEKGVPACAGCHGPSGAGIPTQYPRIGGQWADYTALQLNNFRGGSRKASVEMSAIALKLTDIEIKAVSDYIAGLR